MSAQAIPSVAATAAFPVAHSAAEVDASLFGDLVEVATNDDVGQGGARPDIRGAQGDETSPPDGEATATTDAATISFPALTTPTLLTPPLVSPLAPADGDAVPAPSDTPAATSAQPIVEPAPHGSPVPPAPGAPTAPDPTTPTASPWFARPVAPQTAPLVGEADESVVAPSPEAHAETRPAAAEATVVSRSTPDHATTASAAPSPPPLRALAERTSKPLDPAMATPEDAGRAETSATRQAVSTEPAATVPTPVVRTPDTLQAAAPVAEVISDMGPQEHETARADDVAAPVVRETSPSGLSRGAIEATAQIAAQILRRLEGRSTRFEMSLLPEELGRVDVKLDIDAEGRLAARLAFDNPAAATDLRGRADELRRQLEQQGFHLADDAFEFADRDSGSSAFDRGHDRRDGQSRAFAAAHRLNADADVALQPASWRILNLAPSGVDMKV